MSCPAFRRPSIRAASRNDLISGSANASIGVRVTPVSNLRRISTSWLIVSSLLKSCPLRTGGRLLNRVRWEKLPSVSRPRSARLTFRTLGIGRAPSQSCYAKYCPLRTGGRLKSGIEPESPNRKAAKPYVRWATCPPVVPWTPISHVRIKLASAIPLGKPSPPMSCVNRERLVADKIKMLSSSPRISSHTSTVHTGAHSGFLP